MRRQLPYTALPAAMIAAFLVAGLFWQSDSSAQQQPAWDPVTIARAHLAKVDADVQSRVPSSAAAAAAASPQADGEDVVDVRDSLGATHVRLQQTVNGIPIDGAVSTLSMLPGAAGVTFAMDKHIPAAVASAAPPAISSTQAEQAVTAAVGIQASRGATTTGLKYQREGLGLRLVWQVLAPAAQPLGDWLANVDAQTGDVIDYSNVMAFDSGMVFNPNPYEASGHTVPPPTNCATAPNAATLAPLRTSKTLLGITAAQNKLKGAYVDMTAPGIVGAYKASGQANEPSRVYNYNCNDDRFEEVQTYFHIDATQRKIQSLGFTGGSSILNSPIPAHAHYASGCNAFFSAEDKGLHFFDGDNINCLSDSGEDADVIVHEYGHAIQADEVPGFGFGAPLTVEQTGSMGEGFGDFMTAAMFGDPCVGGWALNELYAPGTHCLRDMQNTHVFPADFDACRSAVGQPAEVHCGGLIWGVLSFRGSTLIWTTCVVRPPWPPSRVTAKS